MARGLRTWAPRQLAGQLKAKEELANGKQLRPSRPQDWALGLDVDQLETRKHVIETHHRFVTQERGTAAPKPAKLVGML